MFKKKKRWHCLAGQQPTEMDLKIMEWERKGKLVPTRELVKTPEQIEGIRVAGKINSGCLDAVAEMIRPGISTKDIDNVCVEYCKAHNAISATLGYEGFPGSLCTSINEVGQSVAPLDQMTQQNAALVEESAAAAESLREQAARLAQLVSQFKLAGGALHAVMRSPRGAAHPGMAPAVPASAQAALPGQKAQLLEHA